MKRILLLALCFSAFTVTALAPAVSADGVGNCPDGWNGVLVPNLDGGDPWGMCCSPWWPMECYAYPPRLIE